MREPIVSIVVAAYNAEAWISECIESVINQTSDHWELILVDDGSTDGTSQIIDRYLVDNRIRKVSCEHRGLAASRNTGLSLTSGEFLALLDADDYLKADFVTSVYEKMAAEELELLYFSSFVFSDDERMNDRVSHLYNYSKRPVESIKIGSGREIFIWLESLGKFVMTGCLQVARASLIERVFGLNRVFEEGIIYEDNPYSLKLAVASNRTGVIADELYCRRVHSESITMTNSENEERLKLNLKSYKRCLENCAELLCSSQKDEELFDSLSGFYGWYAENIANYLEKLTEKGLEVHDDLSTYVVSQLLVSRIKAMNRKSLTVAATPQRRRSFNFFRLGG